MISYILTILNIQRIIAGLQTFRIDRIRLVQASIEFPEARQGSCAHPYDKILILESIIFRIFYV